MNIKNRISALAVAVLLCTISFAQKKAVSGYYLTLAGDTVKGVFPQYAQWNNNPSEVEFSTAGKNTRMLTPSVCRKFVVDGYDEYVAYTGQRLVNPIEDGDVLNKNYSSYLDEVEQVTTFLQLVSRTPAGDLYAFNDNKRVNFYILLPGQALTELRYKKYYSQNQLTELADYKQQLNNLFADNIAQRKLSSSLEQLPYAEGELTAFLQALQPQVKQKQKSRNLDNGWMISAGVMHNSIQAEEEKTFLSVSRKIRSSLSPSLVIGYYHLFNRSFGRYFVYPQLMLFRFNVVDESSDGVFLYSNTYSASLMAAAKLAGGVNVVNQQNLRFFISVGLGLMLPVNGRRIHQRYVAATRERYHSAQETKMAHAAYVLTATTGVILHNRLALSATYLVPSQIMNPPYSSDMLTGTQFSVGYKFR